MKREKKVIKHRILDGNTFLGMFLLTLLSYVMVLIVFSFILGVVLGLAVGMFDLPFNADYVGATLPVFGALLMLAIYKRWFHPEFKGSYRSDRNLGKWMLIGFAVLLAIIVPFLLFMVITKATFAAPTVLTVLTSMMAGTFEEVTYRAIPISYAMRRAKDFKKVPMYIALSTLLFSLSHAVNLLGGASVQATIVQFLATIGLGTLFCALLLRSGSILPSMMVHFLYDVTVLMNADNVKQNGIMAKDLSTRDIILNIAFFVLEMGIALFLLRKSVRGDILEVWKEKWNRNEQTAAPEVEAKAG